MGNPRINRQDTPFIPRHVVCGPFAAADLDTTPASKVLTMVQKPTVLDQVGARLLVQSTTDAVPIQIGWATSGQTLIAAVTANQWLTDTFNIGDTASDIAINTWVNSDDGGDGEAAWDMAGTGNSEVAANAGVIIPAGSQIFVNCPTSAVALDDLFIDLLLREQIG